MLKNNNSDIKDTYGRVKELQKSLVRHHWELVISMVQLRISIFLSVHTMKQIFDGSTKDRTIEDFRKTFIRSARFLIWHYISSYKTYVWSSHVRYSIKKAGWINAMWGSKK